MSILDRQKQMLKGHEDQVSKGVDKAGAFADEKTQGDHSSQIAAAQEKVKEQMEPSADGDNPPQA